MEDNCIFCQIAAGKQQSKKVYDDEHLIGVLDINPCAKGHTLLLPKEHFPVLQMIDQKVQTHLSAKLPLITKAIMDAMLTTGANIMIASGAAAGQQSPHFLLHIIPRESGDNLDKYDLKGAAKHDDNLRQVIREGINQKGEADHIYSDQLLQIDLAKEPVCNGHIHIELNKNYTDLTPEESQSVMNGASACASVVFQHLSAQGSNIIFKTGMSNDNIEGKSSVHILPRFEGDGLDLICPPMKEKPDIDGIVKKIKDQTFTISYKEEKEDIETIDMDKPEVIQMDEISRAINRFKDS